MKLTIEQVAELSHETNRAYCRLLGDDSQVPWDDAPDWQKESAVDGVRAVLDGSAETAEEQHEAWMEHKIQNGWTYGPVKSPELKEHPCMVAYADLPPDQKLKDHLFRAVVLGCRDALAEGEIEAGFTITTERGELHRELDERFPTIVEMRAAVNAARQVAGDLFCRECAMYGKHAPGCPASTVEVTEA